MKVKLSHRDIAVTDFSDYPVASDGTYQLNPGDVDCPFLSVDTEFEGGSYVDLAVIPQPNGTVRIVVTGDPDVKFEVLDDR
ncbi:hypothetical protein MUG78_17925 [Gordonia alkaliphila]|uniref:hypothetical protein n=1 Tax=Gordonia alkaliphila TaxID=1053547 RepID=UPI001FF61909|nr:hypothetical protein [Gordonia alkaliphila]MCK0441281.1 hypothetical protein [Gordonia alkaliphila]